MKRFILSIFPLAGTIAPFYYLCRFAFTDWVGVDSGKGFAATIVFVVSLVLLLSIQTLFTKDVYEYASGTGDTITDNGDGTIERSHPTND